MDYGGRFVIFEKLYRLISRMLPSVAGYGLFAAESIVLMNAMARHISLSRTRQRLGERLPVERRGGKYFSLKYAQGLVYFIDKAGSPYIRNFYSLVLRRF